MTDGLTLNLPHGALALPAFLPDGTQGVVRAVSADDLEAARVGAVQMNVYHLMQRPGTSTIQALGGLHRMAGWRRPIFTDSGGFQVYSLIRQNPKAGSITDRGATFRPGGDRKYILTPEKSIQLQFSYGADMLICLDDCTGPDDPPQAQADSVRRTIRWAGECQRAYTRLVEQKGLAEAERPRLMAVIQGGLSRDLRRECAEALLALGFDAYGYGGWPLDAAGQLLEEMVGYVRELVPPEFPVHALGVGHPASVAACVAMGYQLFDSTMPTRDARHGRLLVFTRDPAAAPLSRAGEWFAYLYPGDDKHVKAAGPVSPHCDCPACARYSLGYLHHLFKLNDNLYFRLATVHNLRFMTMLMERLREGAE
ncbi:tRNA guanosine(34) transglycosylase Tgt [Promineifilum sp.]|uniref:tRNA-ribosyltransferase family protein n=1 Tax=Promineifilum sp. TaxID=2664178 RepID=UPI0035AE7473